MEDNLSLSHGEACVFKVGILGLGIWGLNNLLLLWFKVFKRSIRGIVKEKGCESLSRIERKLFEIGNI
jgi:hypothetical protein